MPLVHVSLRHGKSAAYRRAVLDGIYDALRATFNVPDGNRFMTISEHDAENFNYGERYMEIARSDDLLFIQITVNNTRSMDQKKSLYQQISENLMKNLAVRPEDIFINLIEVAPENWSLGHGIAQYAEQAS